MLEKRRKLCVAIGFILLVMIFCSVSGYRTVRWYQRLTDCHNRNPPLRSFKVKIDVTQQQQLIDQFTKFAKKNGFTFNIIKYTPNGKDFLVDLRRKDTEIFVSNPFGIGEFIVDFHNNDCTHPTVASDIDILVQDLKISISEIPHGLISEE